MTAYANMKNHITPVPTPLVVRATSSVLVAAGVAVMGADLANSWKAATMMLCIGTAMLVIFSHPYRRRMREYTETHNRDYKFRLAALLPLFPVWLALMTMPAFAPLAIGWLIIAGAVTFGWMWLIFPHIDGSRALAFI
ncbi:hypothetical protein ACFSSC_02060 [Corynebacterium mendelii]|uniref:Uncharacterized protein n=2 Tax=Corynebacterium mendelii TaxID=2765362 RepID=A0A939E217_9CORY|nr:hypothetical protein [Corynebacterium mendelii]